MTPFFWNSKNFKRILSLNLHWKNFRNQKRRITYKDKTIFKSFIFTYLHQKILNCIFGRINKNKETFFVIRGCLCFYAKFTKTKFDKNIRNIQKHIWNITSKYTLNYNIREIKQIFLQILISLLKVSRIDSREINQRAKLNSIFNDSLSRIRNIDEIA